MPFNDYDDGPGSGPSQAHGPRRGDGPGGKPNRMPGETPEQYNVRFQAWQKQRDEYAANWDEAMAKQTGLAQEGYERAMSGKDSVAQKQMREGQAQAGRMMTANAVGRGSDPLAQRAAIYGGGEMAGQAANQSAQLRAAETVAARGQYLGALSEQQQGIMGYDQMRMQEAIENARLRQQYLEEQNRESARDWEHGLAVAGLIGGGVSGAVGGAISDARLKQNIRPAFAYSGGAIPSDERLKEKLANAERERDALERYMQSGQMRDLEQAPEGARRAELTKYGLDAKSDINDSMGRGEYGPQQPSQQGSYRGESLALGSGSVGGSNAVDDALRSATGYLYEYTPEAKEKYDVPSGTRYGPMAQNLQRGGPVAKSMVTKTPQGDLAIDRDAAATANLSMTARVNEKIEALKRELDALQRGGQR